MPKNNLKQLDIMTHIVAGFPDFNFNEKLVQIFENLKINFLEIQFPFSDPVADGPVLMKANEISLQNGTKISDCFNFIKKIRSNFSGQIFLMGYFNLIFRMGIEKFCQSAKKFGANGLIFPDIPFDEASNENFLQTCQSFSLPIIQVVSELTPINRLEKMAKLPGEIIYCISRFGTTGDGKFSSNLKNFLERVKQKTNKKIAVGFGITKKEDLKILPQVTEIAVIGSAISKIIFKENKTEEKKLYEIEKLLENLR